MPDLPRPPASGASIPAGGPDAPDAPARTRSPHPGTATLPLALATATGAGAGALVARGPDGFRTTLASPTPSPTDFGIEWSPAATFPDEAVRAAVDGLGLTAGGLGVVTALVALGAAATLLAAVGSLRRRELAVRGALGRGPLPLAALLIRRDGAVLTRGVLLGVAAGVGAAALLHGAWPVERSDAWFGPAAPTLRAVGIAAALTLGVGLGLTVLPARYGVRALARSLAAGSRATADPWEGGLRRVATVFQTAASLALLSSSVLLWQALPGRGATGEGSAPDGVTAANGEAEEERSAADAATTAGAPEGVLLVSAAVGDDADSPEERAARYGELLERLGALPTVAAESIASPGAWTGIATSDFVLADCGNCFRGMFWIPFLGEEAHHHAVSPGFFESAGMELLVGRDFTLGDRADAERVAVVSEPMALKNFEDGDPLGRRIRVGEGMESWYTVVGVVRERRPPGLGLADEPAHAVYLSALQHPPDRVEVAFRAEAGAEEAATPAVRAAATEAGLAVAPGSRTSSSLRRSRAEPLRWAAGASAAFGLIALVSALLGVHRVAGVEVAARRRELGIRLALGSTAGGVTRWVLGRAFRSALLGAFLAVPPTIAVTARLRETLGDVPLFDARAFALLAALLVAAAVAGAWGPARRAARLQPAGVMREE